ncbi:hypothetical protein Nmel_008139 [Mimus melanotis]
MSTVAFFNSFLCFCYISVLEMQYANSKLKIIIVENYSHCAFWHNVIN